MDVRGSGTLGGAHLQLFGTFRAQSLTPIVSTEDRTVWPTTNTSVQLVVNGSQASDGVYQGTIAPSPDNAWIFEKPAAPDNHRMIFPAMVFNVGTTTLNLAPQATFELPLFTKPGTAYPPAFFAGPGSWAISQPVVGFTGKGAYLPEPSSAALAAVGIAAIASLRQRRSLSRAQNGL